MPESLYTYRIAKGDKKVEYEKDKITFFVKKSYKKAMNKDIEKKKILIIDNREKKFKLAKILEFSKENENNQIEFKIIVKVEKKLENISKKFTKIINRYGYFFKNGLKFKILQGDDMEKMRFIIDNSYFVESLIEFLEIQSKIKDNDEFLYRGQSNKKYGLIAGVFREKYEEDKEKSIYYKLEKYNYEEFKNIKSILDKLVKMQHYEIQTRLLDWSKNPLIALFFAILGNRDFDGKLFMYKPQYIIKPTDDDYENIEKLLKFNLYGKSVDVDTEIKEFLIKLYKHYLEGKNFYFIDTIFNNNRIKAQNGYFSVLLDLKVKYGQIIFEHILEEKIRIFMEELKSKNKIEYDNLKKIWEKNILIKFINKYLNEILIIRSEEEIKETLIEEVNFYITKKISDETPELKGKNDKIINKNFLYEISKFLKNKESKSYIKGGVTTNKAFYFEKDYDINLKLNKDDLITFVIPNDKKKDIEKELNSIGFDSISVFPDIQGYAKYIQQEWSEN